MREVLYKAKLKDWKTNPQHNRWVEGYYLSRKETTYCFKEDYEKFPVKILHFIAEECMTDWGLPNDFRLYEIDPDTLCQYIELNDKNDKKIFENDIVGRYSEYQEKYYRGQVGYGEFNCSCCNGVYGWHFGEEDIRDVKYYEVLGNIFDNPEQLEGEE